MLCCRVGVRLKLPRGRRPLAARASAAALVVLAAGAAAAAVVLARGAEARETARLHLLSGRPAEAATLLADPAVRSAGREAAALADVLLGRATSLPARPTTIDLRMLLHTELAAGRTDGCLRLAEAAAPWGEPWAGVYRAAALLEAGRGAEAQGLLAAAPSLFATPGLPSAVSAVLDLEARGATLVLRDARGRLVGGRTAEGALLLAARVDPLAVPEAAVAAAAELAGTAGVRLALDLELSALARDALTGRRGSVVLLDLGTGGVRAACTDARSAAREPAAAFQQRREPASIAKLITTAAALRAGLDPDAEIGRMTCRGVARYADTQLWCSHDPTPLRGLGHALAMSCNTAFANLALRVGRDAMLAEYRRFGFDREPASDWGRVTVPDGDLRQLADLGIGLEASDITPVHAAAMGAVFADGTLPEPTLVAARCSRLGFAVEPLSPPEPRRVLEPAWMALFHEAMDAVVRPGGTANGVSPHDFPVAMKTGTAAEPGQGYHVNYVGVGPMPRPRLAFALRLTHEPTSGHVSRAARGSLRVLLEGLAGRP